ncbi:MAG: hypothetical protein HYV96_05845 [Opitutae bacterium]|nr:hypothetical protein [Opitutae bacterium]
MNTLVSLSDAALLIASGRALALAGSTRALAALPAGNWIGGTSYYFIGPDGGTKSDELVFVTDLSAFGAVTFARYGADEVAKITSEAPEHGFSFVLTPAGSASLRAFAQRPYTDDLFLRPLLGWVAGVDLADLRGGQAQVVDGRTRAIDSDALVVAHVTLPPEKLASISIINPFEKSDAHTLEFDAAGFSATECLVDGRRRRLAEFLVEAGHAHGRLPLVGDFSGAALNVSIQAVELVSGRVDFYAPVFPGVKYHLAQPLADYEASFAAAIAARGPAPVAFSCNCILNYLYGNMESRRTGEILGPVTFGEIGYQLLNQTLVILDIV